MAVRSRSRRTDSRRSAWAAAPLHEATARPVRRYLLGNPPMPPRPLRRILGAMMRSRLLLLPALALLVAPPGTAEAKKKAAPTDALYQVVVRATMDEHWQFLERSEIDCLDGICAKETKGEGSASIQLKAKS